MNLRLLTVELAPSFLNLGKLPGVALSRVKLMGNVASAKDGIRLLKRLRPDVLLISAPVGERGLRGMTRVGYDADPCKVLWLATRKNSEPPLLFHCLGPVPDEATLYERIAQLADDTPTAEGVPVATAVGSQCDELLELTSRELEVLGLTGEGHSGPQVAHRLRVSIHTVRAHLRSIRMKLGVHTAPGLVRYALVNGVAKA
jgi:DNA-binding CsgD family transcriptional regulator